MTADLVPMGKTGQLLMPVEPEAVIERQAQMAQGLMKFLAESKKKVVYTIANKKYLGYEAWVTLCRFDGLVPQIAWTKRFPEDETQACLSYKARCELIDRATGLSVGGAEMRCGRDEGGKWATAPEYALMSQAETRACSKAGRLATSQIVVLAGYEPTPREEMEPIKAQVEKERGGAGGYGARERGRAAPPDEPAPLPDKEEDMPWNQGAESEDAVKEGDILFCPECNGSNAVRKSKYGLWLKCPDCGKKWDEKKGWYSPATRGQ